MSEKNNRNNLDRTVHTGLYGQAAEKMLVAIKNLVKERGSHLDSASFARVEVSRAADNELLLEVYDDNPWNRPLRKTVFTRVENGKRVKDEAAIRKWLAGVIKGATKMRLKGWNSDIHAAEIQASPDWRRDGDIKVSFASPVSDLGKADTVFTVAQAYAAYDSLMGRKVSKTRYPAGIAEQVVGEAFDPIRTEIESFRREEMKRIDGEEKAAIKDIDAWYSSEHQKLFKTASEKKAAACCAAANEREKVNAEIDASLATAARPSETAPTRLV